MSANIFFSCIFSHQKTPQIFRYLISSANDKTHFGFKTQMILLIFKFWSMNYAQLSKCTKCNRRIHLGFQIYSCLCMKIYRFDRFKETYLWTITSSILEWRFYSFYLLAKYSIVEFGENNFLQIFLEIFLVQMKIRFSDDRTLTPRLPSIVSSGDSIKSTIDLDVALKFINLFGHRKRTHFFFRFFSPFFFFKFIFDLNKNLVSTNLTQRIIFNIFFLAYFIKCE